MDNYFGTYAIGKATSKEEAGKLLGADNIIGDVYKVGTKLSDGKHVARVINRFGNSPVDFCEDISREIALCEAKGFITYAILTCVGFTQIKNDGEYWSEFIIISFPEKDLDIFSVYVENLSNEVKNYKRPEVDLKAEEVEEIIKNKGNYVSLTQQPKLDKIKGQVILKSRVKLSEKLIEQGRKKNPGCYIFGWLFLLAAVALIILIIKAIFKF